MSNNQINQMVSLEDTWQKSRSPCSGSPCSKSHCRSTGTSRWNYRSGYCSNSGRVSPCCPANHCCGTGDRLHAFLKQSSTGRSSWSSLRLHVNWSILLKLVDASRFQAQGYKDHLPPAIRNSHLCCRSRLYLEFWSFRHVYSPAAC